MISSSRSNNSSPICRICLSSDEQKSLIAPCKCKGTVKYVHRTCLMQWRKRLLSNGIIQELDICTLCKFRYVIKQKSKFENAMTQPGIRFIVTCIIIFIMLFLSGHVMKLMMLLTSKIYLHDEIISNISFCSTLTKATTTVDTIILKVYRRSLISIIMDEDFWFRVMCNDIIQHFRLGLFFLGSASNVVTAYFMMDELLDSFHHHQLQQQHQLPRNFRHQSKKIILWGSCGMIFGFCFYYILSTFKMTTNNQEELPLCILRWITLSMSVFDFGLRKIFWRLNKINFGDGEILSIQKMDF